MSAPVKHTCPDIDRIINHILSAYKAAKEAQNKLDVDNDAHGYLEDVIYNLAGLDSDIEDLRSANKSLRDWGEELESQLDNVDN